MNDTAPRRRRGGGGGGTVGVRLLLLVVVAVGGGGAAAGGAMDAPVPIPQVLHSAAAPPIIKASSWLLMEQESGWILNSGDPDRKIPPASLTKIMTAYLAFKSLALDDLDMEDRVHISKKAWQQEGSRMFVEVDTMVSAADLLHGLIVQSGNDAAVALAEYMAGSEEGFVGRMNQAAAELGMTGSHFSNSTGLPAPDHYTTVRDLSILTRRMIDEFPQYYAWHKKKEFVWNNIRQKNRNALLWVDDSVDGVKTGYTDEAGYCLVASAQRKGLRLIASVVGATDEQERIRAVRSLLAYGYANYRVKEVAAASQPLVELDLYYGDAETMALGVAGGIRMLRPRGIDSVVTMDATHPAYLQAPLPQGAAAGSVRLLVNGNPVAEHALVTLNADAGGGWFSAIGDYVLLFLRR